MARKFFVTLYIAITILFAACSLALIVFAARQLWQALELNSATAFHQRLAAVLEAVGLLTIAVAALELSQTVLEEEVVRESDISAPTRVRRFLSRFLIVVVVSLSVESLVAVFKFMQDSPQHLPRAAMIAFAAAALVASWGVFVHLNRSAEELEPEAMQRAKKEDHKVESSDLDSS